MASKGDGSSIFPLSISFATGPGGKVTYTNEKGSKSVAHADADKSSTSTSYLLDAHTQHTVYIDTSAYSIKMSKSPITPEHKRGYSIESTK